MKTGKASPTLDRSHDLSSGPVKIILKFNWYMKYNTLGAQMLSENCPFPRQLRCPLAWKWAAGLRIQFYASRRQLKLDLLN